MSSLLDAFDKFNEENPDAFDWAFWFEKDESKLIEPQLLYDKNGLELHLTCGAVPEQYDVFLKDTETQAGYLRLRHGEFRVDFPDCGGETIYNAEPNGDGVFEDAERMKYLTEAMHAILKKLNNEQKLNGSDTTMPPKK